MTQLAQSVLFYKHHHVLSFLPNPLDGLLAHTRNVIFHQDVRGLGQLMQDLDAFGMLK